jgi:hypothetical protein
MSAYTANVGTTSVSIAPPPGSIMAYLGSNDPDGWVICDGVARTNTNERYNNLITMGIGSSIGGNYTPPNYKGAFLRGTGTSGNYSGPALGNAQNHATQTHNHTINDPGHAHSYTNGYFDQTLSYVLGSGGQRGVTNFNTTTSTTGISINNSTINVDPNETRPYNFGVNWIIKL